MEHTLQKYLERQTTEKLCIALQSYSKKMVSDTERQYIRVITEILHDRGVEISQNTNVDND